MEPSTPPRISNPPPPSRGGAPGRFQRSYVVESTGSRTRPTIPPRYPSTHQPQFEGDNTAAVAASDSASEASENNPNAIIPAGLTEDAVQRAFGGGGATPTLAAARKAVGGGAPPSGAAGGGGVGSAGRGRHPGGIIMPTRKEGNDSVSMYSMSQSVLPLDPRERIYYRPRRHLLQCYVQRKKPSGLGIASLLPGSRKSFHFFLEHTDEFVLAAVPHNAKSLAMAEDASDGVGGHFYAISKGSGNIAFTINPPQLGDDARSFVGKLSRRGGGLEMVMFSEGDKATRKEIVAVLLENFEDTSRSSFTVILPAIDAESGYIKPVEGGEVKFLRDGRAGIDAAMAESSDEDVEATTSMMPNLAPKFAAVDEATVASAGGRGVLPGEVLGSQKKWRSHSVLAREYKRDPRSAHIIVLKNKVPQWDGVLRGYKLDFHGRATKASEKNFQLVATSDPEKVVMLFGRQNDDRFALDFRYPLCGLQAAAIATTIMTARKIIK